MMISPLNENKSTNVASKAAMLTGVSQCKNFVLNHSNPLYLDAPFTFLAVSSLARDFIGFPFRMMYSLLAPALFIVELIGLYQRKSFTVPFGRAVLVVTMVFFFPVGTIFGGIMWKRFNHPVTKKYLNYEDEHTMEEDEKEDKDKK